ncbi:hypothetical protein ASPVEDRAFT_45353 [Aspergillus versicolor CBS 583.65]|uniref:Uncharacterized protein n=1 Tax=Aspergillus versicolor CBS 583.65 TaxID=1036611 RepID=A0A1L9PWR9_ASPVE|nr:uncharacterized protein ASPVEDRAFT_45353 [Aspergillus versicolor CBS 583.65]OJJ05905.1 hypothetical protein ASPVEDRAFT_45353 [Aspergillus versicolor CBS 583.65]
MSDILRRASDAFHHRQRQESTDSTAAPKSPDAAKLPEQEPLDQSPESAQPDPHGAATDNVAHPKQHHRWGWGHRQANKIEAKQQPSQQQTDNTDWVMGS